MIMDNDQPYTSPDEDPFSLEVKYIPPTPVKAVRHKRSSMLDQWIKELQEEYIPADDFDPPMTPYSFAESSSATFRSTSNPYLAYPDLPRLSLECNKSGDDAQSIISYDLVDDDDIPPSADTTITAEASVFQDPITPVSPPPLKSPRHSLAPSFRNLNLTFRSNSPLVPSATNMEASPRSFARLPFFPRTPRSSTAPASESPSTPQHSRTASLSTLETTASFPSVKLPASTSKWRPSVLGHFHQPSASQSSIAVSESHYTPSRPSISSGETYITSSTSQTGTSLESGAPALSTPSKVSLFESLRLSSKSPKALSTFSLGSTSSVRLPSSHAKSQPRHASHSSLDFCSQSKTVRKPFAPKGGSLDNIDDEDDLDAPATYRASKHESTRHAIPYSSGGTLSRMTLSSLSTRSLRKKKKLIISGIGATEIRKFEGVKRWCESFGTVRQISRLANGDLLVDWRDPEVAETVCRVRAKVFIGGVGSVQLSWTVGNKR